MSVRLADGVVAGRGLRTWALPGDTGAPANGAAVALGPVDACAADAADAVATLEVLVALGGVVAAGARVDLGAGFRSARLPGARGDRRDAVLAALRALGPAEADRLGDRAAVMVALFGPAVTRPVGAAAGAAVAAGRYGVLGYASAASDVLGPEQLVTLLALDPAPGVDPLRDAVPSTLAAQLGRLLTPLPRPARLRVLVDLWDRVQQTQARANRRFGLLAARPAASRAEAIERRRDRLEDELLLEAMHRYLGPGPTVVAAARWTPPEWYQAQRLRRVRADALAATALGRAALAVFDHGFAAGMSRWLDALGVAGRGMTEAEAGRAARRIHGMTGLPARPGCYTRAIHARLTDGRPVDAPAEAYVRERLGRARDYAGLALDAVTELLDHYERDRHWPVTEWSTENLRTWRAAAGYVRPPAGWDQPPLPVAAQPRPLAMRLAADPAADPADVELTADLLWYADLADTIAELDGHDAARIEHGAERPLVRPAAPTTPDPLVPPLDSVPAAVAAADQLVSLGGAAPHRCRTWSELVAGLTSGATLLAALSDTFRVPEPLRSADRTTLPGTDLRVEVAFDRRTLAGWGAYMGNCIGGYGDLAADGRYVLLALRDPDGRITANASLARRYRSAGWMLDELRARFNNDPDPELERLLRRWVAGVRGPAAPAAPPDPALVPEQGSATPCVHRAAPTPSVRLQRAVAEPLGRLAAESFTDLVDGDTATVLAALAVRVDGTARPTMSTVVVALRRVSTDRLLTACREVLDLGRVPLPALWAAGGVRPLRVALDRLDADRRERFDQLDLLRLDNPLPGSVRGLARRSGVAAARSADLVALRIRRAIGRLTRDADPVLAAALIRDPRTDVLCALTLVTTCAGPSPAVTPVTRPPRTRVPGAPSSSLRDPAGPWQAAWPHACELGAGRDAFRRRIATTGLLVPTGWLEPNGWPALWARAAKHSA